MLLRLNVLLAFLISRLPYFKLYQRKVSARLMHIQFLPDLFYTFVQL